MIRKSLVLLAGLGLMTACESVGLPEDPTSVEEEYTAGERDFLRIMEESPGNGLNEQGETALLYWGHDTCEDLDRGMSVKDIISDGMDSGYELYNYEYAVGAAIDNLCPEHTPDKLKYMEEMHGA